MRPSEWLALGYFLVLAAAGVVLLGRRRGAWRSVSLSLGGCLVAAAGPRLPDVTLLAGGTLRDWWLLLALPLAYWVPAPLVAVPDLRLERTLLAMDAASGLRPVLQQAHPLLELSYLLVYPMVPAGLAAVLAAGGLPADTYWLALLVSVLPCYGLLPLLPTRPPRALLAPDPQFTRSSLPREANVRFLATFGNGWNTVPSGHAAGAVAVTMLVWRSGSPLSAAFALLAAGVALATIRGRYHFVADTVLGIALGLAAGLLVGSAGNLQTPARLSVSITNSQTPNSQGGMANSQLPTANSQGARATPR